MPSGSISTGSKNEIDAEKYYQNKTKSEIAFLKRKEELVSFRLHLHLVISRKRQDWITGGGGSFLDHKVSYCPWALFLSLYILILGC